MLTRRKTRELAKEDALARRRESHRKLSIKTDVEFEQPDSTFLERERQRKVRELVERKDLLAKALHDALEQNQRLLKEAKRRRSIEKQCEEEKSLTEMLSIITQAVTEAGKLQLSSDEM